MGSTSGVEGRRLPLVYRQTETCFKCGDNRTWHTRGTGACIKPGCGDGCEGFVLWGPHSVVIGKTVKSGQEYCVVCGCWPDAEHASHLITDESASVALELPPVSLTPLPGYRVTYAVNGGQGYEIDIPGDASVMAIDGKLVIAHPDRPVLGIVSVRTYPTLTQAEEKREEPPDSQD
jgi:hypothetical protein